MASVAFAETYDVDKRQLSPKDRLIVALDVASVEEADRIVDGLGDSVDFFKIGMQLQFAVDGLGYAKRLLDKGKRVFLDSKLFDISETVERAVENVARMGVDFLTVHGNGPTIQAAVKGRGNSKLQILSVTVLTSLDAEDLKDLGFKDVAVAQLVLHRAKKALEAGADGVIASGEEVAGIREFAGNKLAIITPGIRPFGSAPNDQKRVVTPAEAIMRGADYLVVGRPITQSADPQKSAERIVGEIEHALARAR